MYVDVHVHVILHLVLYMYMYFYRAGASGFLVVNLKGKYTMYMYSVCHTLKNVHLAGSHLMQIHTMYINCSK